ncbi:MAG: hypothetical protein LQ348_004087 [Seirophora lacunosa]|nr:MAG: hypothetical protein LQ348_004087 [Seirophora lacunosa]
MAEDRALEPVPSFLRPLQLKDQFFRAFVHAVNETLLTRKPESFGWDDGVMVITQMANLTGMGFVAAEVENGLGRHRYYLKPGAFKKFLKYDYLDWAQVFVTLALCKISICLFLLRLSSFRRLRWWLHGLIVFLIVSHLPLLFLVIFQCTPISKYWTNPLEGPGVCFTKATVETIIIIQGVISIVTDFIGAGFPIVLLWNVQLRKRTKMGLCMLMGLGVVTAAICIVRTALSGSVKSMDVTWGGVPNAFSRIFEINLGIVAACVPIMKPLYRYIHAKATGQDPHNVLYRTHTPSASPSLSNSHRSWYRRLKLGSRGYGSTSNKSVPWGAVHYPSLRQPSGQDLGTQQSLNLPLEGPRVETHIEGGLPNLHEEKSKRSLQSQLGPVHSPLDRIPFKVPLRAGISHTSLPHHAVFPGPWEEYIKAPRNRSYIRPDKIWHVEGPTLLPEALLGGYDSASSMTLDPGGLVILEFAENIAGRQERDLPLYLLVDRTGLTCVRPEFVRGAFKYLTIYIPEHPPKPEDIWSETESPPASPDLDVHLDSQQKHLGVHDETSHHHHKRRISISSVFVNCTAFPSNPNPRAYTGYFSSSSTLLNRIWYSGAYTLQLTTIDPAEGSALIDYNRPVDHNQSPQGSWYSNFTIANGTAVTTDGAKRDRMAYPGDMAIAVPGIAVSTYDMVAVCTALDSLFIRQYADGALPYAGPPMGYSGEFSDTYHMHTLLGVWNYILFTDDLPWLRSHWGAYLQAFEYSLAKVDRTGLFHVTSTNDWLRPGMTGHNLEATSLMTLTPGRSSGDGTM